MAPIHIPSKLRELLVESPFEAPTAELSEAVGTILNANAMPFFPAFTDHGTQHVEQVLSAVVKLIPEKVWKKELLDPPDAAVLICAALLHDLAMHVSEAGFVELVSEKSRFKPSQWFDKDQVGRPADLPWSELWTAFQREAGHFGTSQLELLFGPASDGVPPVAHEEGLNPQRWTESDRLLVGEFLRRHHGRLSHEIALHGFPGADAEQFPVLATTMADFADAVGVLARSHNEPLRRMLDYLTFLERGPKRPGGTFLPYHMSLLRIADYLQLAAHRAPSLLLRLKSPVSPVSIGEWNRHQTVISVEPDYDDPQAIFVRVSSRHTLRTHLALGEVLADLQRELDTTTAVLSVVYPSGKLAALRLTCQRVLTNLQEPSLQERLPYLARRASLRSDPDLFRLVIRDLYGNQPAVAGRELVQNAVDAVRARRAAEDRRGQPITPEALRQLDADVVVSIDEEEDGQHCVLRVADRGIGMSPDLVVDYFLQAGASFGPTTAEIEDLDREEAVASMRAGRFGVGAFAGFLLGPEIAVTTRHIDADRGVSFRARIDGDLVQLDWDDEAPVGTEVTIRFDTSVIPGSRWSRGKPGTPQDLLQTIAQFYRLSDPSVAFVHSSIRRGVEEIAAPADVPPPGEPLPSQWRSVACEGYDSVLWHVESGFSQVVHNGIDIRDLPREGTSDGLYDWSNPNLKRIVRRPRLAVFDSRHLLGVALHRYGLVEPRLPFEEQLLESIGADILARALVLGPGRHPIQPGNSSPMFGRADWMPLLPTLLHRYLEAPLLVLWCIAKYGNERDVDSPSPATLLRPDSPVAWDSYPHRAHVLIAGTPQDIAPTAASLAQQLGGRELATVVMGRPKPRSKMFEATFDEARRGRFGGFSVDSQGIRTSVSGSGDRGTHEALKEVARTLLAESRIDLVALTAFGGFTGAGEGEERLSTPWIEALGGGLSRAGDERERTLKRVLGEDPSLEILVEGWRRRPSPSQTLVFDRVGLRRA